MGTRTKSEEAEARKALAPFVEALIRATPERLREMAAGVAATALPAVVRLIAERLVARLDDGNAAVRAGAAGALVALGSAALPALESAALAAHSERCLRELGPVFVALGRGLPLRDRTLLQAHLMIAAGRAPTPEGAAALWLAVSGLRDPAPDQTASAPSTPPSACGESTVDSLVAERLTLRSRPTPAHT